MSDKKTNIFQSGKEVFSAKGFKDTKISDITERAGVAVGTFYSFYSSKEELFLEIFMEENRRLKDGMEARMDFSADPVTLMKDVLAFNYEGMKANPILREWYNPDVYAKLERHYRAANEKNDALFVHEGGAQLVSLWQREGKIRSDIDTELILALFHTVTYIDTHKEAIGLQFFPRLTDYLTEFIMRGVMTESRG